MDVFGRQKYVEPDYKEIRFKKNPDGSVDQTPRVLLVFPVFMLMWPEAFMDFLSMGIHAGRFATKYQFDVHVRAREILHAAMNGAAEICISNPWYAGMIMFDDDCRPPQNTIPRLLAHFEHGHHVVGGWGFMRKYPYTTTLARWLPHGPTLFREPGKRDEQRGFEWLDDVDKLTPDEHGLVDVDFCGVPAMFVSRQTLVTLKDEGRPIFGTADKTGAEMTHDVYFCNRLKDAGVPIKIDLTLECGHISEAPTITRANRNIARAAVDFKLEDAVNGVHGERTPVSKG